MLKRRMATVPPLARLYVDGRVSWQALHVALGEHERATDVDELARQRASADHVSDVDEVAAIERRINNCALAFKRASQAVAALPDGTPLRSAVLLAWAGDDVSSARWARYRDRIAARAKANANFAFQVAATVEAMLNQLAKEDPLYRMIQHDVLLAIESDAPEVHRLLRARKAQLSEPLGTRMRPAHVLRETQKQLVALGEQASVRVDLPHALPRTWAAMTALYDFLDEQLQPGAAAATK